jgi:DtxR family Mn-dependent transcriptional regulator
MTIPPSGLSPSVEDYLKAIYALCQGGGAATTNAIAEALSVQPASVTGMVKRLAEAGYLEHAPYHGVRLTTAGVREALRVVRRHRILETYLKERLGYSWEGVHAEAERLEHAASDELIERMARALENPSHDPHGAPIPSRSGTVEAVELATLAEAEVGTEVEVTAVQDDDPERLRTMEDWDLVPGALLTIRERDPYDGVVTVDVQGSGSDSRTVGRGLARRIYVTPVARTGGTEARCRRSG